MLRCFVVTAQSRSLATAADRLGRTPSAVSMVLKQLEDHIGFPLFVSSRKSQLTELGVLIYEEAQRSVGHFEKTVNTIENIASSNAGYLRLAVAPSFASTILPTIIRAYTDRHPQVQIDIRDMDSMTIVQELIRGSADVGIGTLPKIEGMVRQELFSDPFGVVCRNDSPLAENWSSLTWHDLKESILISNGLCDLIQDPDFAPMLMGSKLRVLNVSSLLGLVRQGVGITVLPEMATTYLPEDLVFLPLRNTSDRRTVNIVIPHQQTLMPAAKAFFEQVRALQKNSDFLNKAL